MPQTQGFAAFLYQKHEIRKAVWDVVGVRQILTVANA